MAWYWIVLVTVVAVHAFNLAFILIRQYTKVLDSFDSDSIYFLSCFLVYIPLKILLYPIEAHFAYKLSWKFYQRNGISYWQFMFGKRPRE